MHSGAKLSSEKHQKTEKWTGLAEYSARPVFSFFAFLSRAGHRGCYYVRSARIVKGLDAHCEDSSLC